MTESLSPINAVEFLIERAKKQGADAAESFGVSSTSVSAEVRGRKTETLEYSETSGVDLHVFCGKKQALISSSVLDTKTLDELAGRAVEMAKAVPDDPYSGLADPEMQAKEFEDLDLYDSAVQTTESLLELALRTEAAALDVKGVTQSNGVGASTETTEIIMASTTGFNRRYKRSNTAFSVSALAQDKDGAKETDYDYSSAVYLSDLASPEEIGRSAGERTVKRLGAKKIPSAVMDVILEPRIAKGLLGILASAINGTSIARGTSFLKESMGEQLFSQNLSVIENPHRLRGQSSRPCDAEGLPTVRRAIIDHGILTTWMLDLHSARKLGLAPTGHASRGLGGNTHPAPSNMSLTGGTVTPEELMSDIKQGLYITQLFGQGVNMITGDYSRGASGFLIENGKITAPVHEITIAGTLKDMFRNMAAANDLDERYAFSSPTVRLFNMSVAGK